MTTNNRFKKLNKIIERLELLRRFKGDPPEFWPEYFTACVDMVEAGFGALIVKSFDRWNNMGVWPAGKDHFLDNPDIAGAIEKITESVLEKGYATISISGKNALAAISLSSGYDAVNPVAVFKVPESSIEETLTNIRFVADIPFSYQSAREADKARNDVVRFADTLDIMTLMNNEKKFMATAMLFCNEIASRYKCTRTSLGWYKEGYVKVQAISHIEQFEKKMTAVQLLEAAMEETFDQDEEIVFPQPLKTGSVTVAHKAFADKHGVSFMVSLPVRVDDEIFGVLVCEREKTPFAENEIFGLRLFCDQASTRLFELKKNDKWFGAKVTDFIGEKSQGLLGVEHTFSKLIGILVFCILSFILFGKMEYRVEAPFIIKTDDVAYLPTPFEGYIKDVHVQVGDVVQKNQLLLSLNTQELLIEESAAIADKSRYLREAEKSRAKYALADMKIANALKLQADAKLKLIRYHLANANVKAPFSGIVVEGDLKEMSGAPVRKGDVLFKIARIEKMYAELDLDERDVHEINQGRLGEIAFVSMPDQKYPIIVETIDPVAISREEGNVFPVRCRFTKSPEVWWRPGMSGVSKINVGKRNVLWIITHRTVAFFRLLFWW
jgi:multidrug resistance efflux pump